MENFYKTYFKNSQSMEEIPDESIQLTVTSPPYFNSPFDYKGVFKDYHEYFVMLCDVAEELYRVTAPGRIVMFNVDDMLVEGEKFPIVADVTRILMNAGFKYRDRIIWKKPDGYLRISRRSGVMIQHPYPMYYYPDNLVESLLIFQKGKFNYKSVSQEIREASKVDIEMFQNHKWYRTLWEMTNVLPNAKLEKGIAAFPEELARRFVILFSYVGETVLDPFLGSGTTMKVSRDFGRSCIGYDADTRLKSVIQTKVGEDVEFFGAEQ